MCGTCVFGTCGFGTCVFGTCVFGSTEQLVGMRASSRLLLRVSITSPGPEPRPWPPGSADRYREDVQGRVVAGHVAEVGEYDRRHRLACFERNRLLEHVHLVAGGPGRVVGVVHAGHLRVV